MLAFTGFQWPSCRPQEHDVSRELLVVAVGCSGGKGTLLEPHTCLHSPSWASLCRTSHGLTCLLTFHPACSCSPSPHGALLAASGFLGRLSANRDVGFLPAFDGTSPAPALCCTRTAAALNHTANGAPSPASSLPGCHRAAVRGVTGSALQSLCGSLPLQSLALENSLSISLSCTRTWGFF